MIFYGTAVSPVRLRSSQGSPLAQGSEPFAFPAPSTPAFTVDSDPFAHQAFANLPNIFSAAGSDPEVSIRVNDAKFSFEMGD